MKQSHVSAVGTGNQNSPAVSLERVKKRAADSVFPAHKARRALASGVVFSLALLASALLALASAPEAAALDKPTCDGSLQALVDAATPGSVVEAPGGCVYRQVVTINKPLTLQGGSGAEIRGSEVWTDWTQSGSRWVKGTLPAFPAQGQCKTGTTRCLWPEQVFFDGEPLLQVAFDPTSGQFAVDANRNVILADNPAGHTVDVTVRRQWISGQVGSVTIEGFTMKHAANDAQSGAIRNNGNPDWTVRNNDLSHAHGANVTLGGGVASLTIANNKLHHAGQYAISSSNSDLEVLDNEIYENNTEDFDTGWAAGGMKVASMVRLLASGNDIHDNPKGIWTDTGSNNVTITNNRVHHNDVRGIDLEITDNVEVSGNAVYENGWVSEQAGLNDAGILLKSVRDAQIHDNTVVWNDDGIIVLNSERNNGVGATDPKFDLVYNVAVHHNDIFSENVDDGSRHVALGWLRLYPAGNIYDPAANNRGNDNQYYFYTPESSQVRYRWNMDLSSLDAFNATPGEERGRYLSDAEKNTAAATGNVPASPERNTPPPPPADTTAPTVNCAAADTLWHKADVSIACTASDDGSGLADPGDANFSLSTSVPADTETADAQTGTRKVCDVAGNCATAGPVGGNMVDKKAPTVTITTPPTGASYTFKQSVLAAYDCSDGGSGVASCAGPVANGNAIDTASVGAKSLVVNASDEAGNTATLSRSYEVRYAFSGFFQPVDNLPTINVMRAGDAVPVIFSLSGNQGLSIFDAGSPSSTRITCPTAPSNDVEQRVNANSSNLSYSTSTDRYTYAWKTNGSWKGTCRQLTLKLKDGSVRQANFRFR